MSLASGVTEESPNTTPLNEELDKLFEPLIDNPSLTLTSTYWNEAKQELTNLIQTLEVKARKEAVDYFYWRIDCNTLISELEGWRGCIDNAKDQTERHFSELGERGTAPNNTTTRSKE